MTRSYTVEQADRTLPLVRRIVADLVSYYADWQEAVREFEIAASSSRADLPNARAEELQRRALSLAAEIEGFVGELAALSITCKSFEVGLIDFPASLAGRPVYLCWRLGEPSVQYWHELDAGFAGRQPLQPRAAA
jgi:hypothetical protein